jgi:hypothetical protein
MPDTMSPRPSAPGPARRARILLAALLLAMATGAYFGRAPRIPGATLTAQADPTSFGDIAFHRLIVARLHAGDRYYDIYGPELRQHGYATRPVFHWRLPTLDWLLAALPDARLGRGLLVCLALGMVLVWSDTVRRDFGLPSACGAALLLLPSLVAAAVGDCFYQHDLWAGVLIALSLGLHRRSRPAGIACGLAALAIRELALPYVLVMLLTATRERRPREALTWGLGLAGFAVLLGVHAGLVAPRILPTDPSDPAWIRFGGWPFLAACSGWLFLTLAPYWLTAALSVPAVCGAFASGNVRLSATLGLYLVTFAVIGKPFDHYWGLIYAPLLAVGLVYSVPMTARLVRAAWAGPAAPAGAPLPPPAEPDS